jgi:hypothetical protein
MFTTNPFAPRPPVRIKLRDDSPSGITLEGGDVLYPGEAKDVEYHLASHLVTTGRATIVQPVQPDPAAGDDEFAEKLGDDELDPKLDDEIVEEPESPVVVETRDPKPSRRR